MYRIAVLAEQEAERQRYAEQITRFCEAKGLFPQVMQYDDQERVFKTAQKDAPTNAVIALSGVTGLNGQHHDGTMTLHWADGWFTLRILLPVPS